MSRSIKAQVVIEYITYFGITMILFISTLFFLNGISSTSQTQRESDALYALANDVQQSFVLFSGLDPYVNTTLELPDFVNAKNYTAEILASKLYLTQDDVEVIVVLPTVNGTKIAKSFILERTTGGIQLS